eukprot:scaffold19570_cov33-Phaeocystis_antarctica.AAC.3
MLYQPPSRSVSRLMKVSMESTTVGLGLGLGLGLGAWTCAVTPCVTTSHHPSPPHPTLYITMRPRPGCT